MLDSFVNDDIFQRKLFERFYTHIVETIFVLSLNTTHQPNKSFINLFVSYEINIREVYVRF